MALMPWPKPKSTSMNTAFKFALSSGARKNEYTRENQRDARYYRRSNFTLYNNGEEVVITRAALQAARNGWYVRCVSVSSKADQQNTEWGSRPMWFVIDDTQPLNFGAAWLEYERAHPCEPSQRDQWAAFSPTGGAEPWGADAFAVAFKQLAERTIGPINGLIPTPHWLCGSPWLRC